MVTILSKLPTNVWNTMRQWNALYVYHLNHRRRKGGGGLGRFSPRQKCGGRTYSSPSIQGRKPLISFLCKKMSKICSNLYLKFTQFFAPNCIYRPSNIKKYDPSPEQLPTPMIWTKSKRLIVDGVVGWYVHIYYKRKIFWLSRIRFKSDGTKTSWKQTKPPWRDL